MQNQKRNQRQSWKNKKASKRLSNTQIALSSANEKAVTLCGWPNAGQRTIENYEKVNQVFTYTEKVSIVHDILDAQI